MWGQTGAVHDLGPVMGSSLCPSPAPATLAWFLGHLGTLELQQLLLVSGHLCLRQVPVSLTAQATLTTLSTTASPHPLPCPPLRLLLCFSSVSSIFMPSALFC